MNRTTPTRRRIRIRRVFRAAPGWAGWGCRSLGREPKVSVAKKARQVQDVVDLFMHVLLPTYCKATTEVPT